jgi:hypothetical protein
MMILLLGAGSCALKGMPAKLFVMKAGFAGKPASTHKFIWYWLCLQEYFINEFLRVLCVESWTRIAAI